MSITIRRTRAAGVALAVALAAACAMAAAPSAHAVNLLTCPAGNVTGTASPALTNTPTLASFSYTANYGTCIGLSPLTRTGGYSLNPPPALRSCTDLLQSRSGVTHTVNWSTGTTSTFTGDWIVDYVNGTVQITEVGTVTAGEFLGGHVVAVVELLADPLACSTTGSTSASGPVTLTITP